MKKWIPIVFSFISVVGLFWFIQTSYSAPAADAIMPVDANVLAIFPLDGDTNDYSGNNRHANLLGGTFVTTTLGSGLQISGTGGIAQGFEWNAYANQLAHPYTIEMILTPDDTTSFAKLFSFDDASDNGWYYTSSGFRPFPNPGIASGNINGGELHYFAFVSTSDSTMDVYFQGNLIGSVNASFTLPISNAVFFNDDSYTSRNEQVAGVVEEVRISNVARTAEDILAVQQTIERTLNPLLYYFPVVFSSSN